MMCEIIKLRKVFFFNGRECLKIGKKDGWFWLKIVFIPSSTKEYTTTRHKKSPWKIFQPSNLFIKISTIKVKSFESSQMTPTFTCPATNINKNGPGSQPYKKQPKSLEIQLWKIHKVSSDKVFECPQSPDNQQATLPDKATTTKTKKKKKESTISWNFWIWKCNHTQMKYSMSPSAFTIKVSQ